MFTMILVIKLYNSALSVTTTQFNSEARCIEAISKTLEMQKGGDIVIRARCVKQ